jgi:4-hydroxybenzoyl-CoA reductase subunit alpha
MAPYRVPNMKYEGYSVYTNNLVRAPQRGHGAPKMRFAAESQFDMIAEELGIDPIEFRLRNVRKPGDMLPNGDSVKNFGLSECISRAAERTDFRNKFEAAIREREKDSKIKYGIGIGTTAYFGGSLIYPNSSSVMVKMNDDGSVTLQTGALDVGQGCETILSQIVAEELRVPVEEVQVYAADTETTPVDIGSWISGLTYVTGNAAKKAAANAMKKLLAVAAGELDADVKDLVAHHKEIFVSQSPDKKISYAQVIAASIAKNMGDSIIGEGHFRTMKDVPTHPSLATTKGRWSENYSSYAQVAEVEVNTETGVVKILKATTAHDCGFPVNPALVEGQIDGQVSMGQGHMLTEELRVENGCIINPSFLEYKIPCALDMVETEYIDVITERYERDRHYNTKEVGEGYVSGTVASLANAVYNATGVRVEKTPIHPQDIVEALEKRRAEKATAAKRN